MGNRRPAAATRGRGGKVQERVTRTRNNIADTNQSELLLRNIRNHKMTWKPNPDVTPAQKALAWKKVAAKSGLSVEHCKSTFSKLKQQVIYRVKGAIHSQARTPKEVVEHIHTGSHRGRQWEFKGRCNWLVEYISELELQNLGSTPVEDLATSHPEVTLDFGDNEYQLDGNIDMSTSNRSLTIDDSCHVGPHSVVEHIEVSTQPKPVAIGNANVHPKVRASQRQSGLQANNSGSPRRRKTLLNNPNFNISVSPPLSQHITLIDMKREEDDAARYLYDGPPVSDRIASGPGSSTSTFSADNHVPIGSPIHPPFGCPPQPAFSFVSQGSYFYRSDNLGGVPPMDTFTSMQFSGMLQNAIKNTQYTFLNRMFVVNTGALDVQAARHVLNLAKKLRAEINQKYFYRSCYSFCSPRH